MVSLNKALLNPYFWGGTLGGVGWIPMKKTLFETTTPTRLDPTKKG